MSSRELPSLPALGLAAAAGAAAGVLIAGNFFTEGKKIRHPITSPYGVGDDPFIRSMGQLLGPPLVNGNQVTTLQNGVEIFPAMLAGIRSAKESITFENFIWYKGRIATQFAEALAERACAGVRVHVLQDGLGCNCHGCDELEHMKRCGVELEMYRFSHLTRINQRTHRKLLVIDGKVGFTGGVGIADTWDGHGNKPEEWRDTHYCLEGPAVAQMQQAFMDNWMQTRAVMLHGDEYFPAIEEQGSQVCQVFKSSADEGSDSARMMLLLTIACARRTVRIANAYFLPDSLVTKTLIDARKRGVDIEIIVPGPLIDQKVVRMVSRSLYRPLLEAGIEIYEFAPTLFHCKYMIADECWSSVGSTNFDDRSLRLNEEANLNVLDEQFAKNHLAVFERDKAQSVPIRLGEWKRRSLTERAVAAVGGLFQAQL